MILGFALVLTLLQVGVSFAEPLNQAIDQADWNDLEQSIDKLQNFFHKVHATNQHEFASQHLPRPHRPALSLTQLQADLNNLEQSVDKLQNNFHEVCSTNQQNVAPQHVHLPRHPNPQLRAMPQPMPCPNPCTLGIGIQRLDSFGSSVQTL